MSDQDPVLSDSDKKALVSPRDPSSKMKRVVVGQVSIDQCPKTGGLWFDFNEWEKLEGLKPAQLDPLIPKETGAFDEKVKPLCPRCGPTAMLIRVKNIEKNVTVLQCPVCRGYWVDGPDVKKILSKGGIFGFLKKMF
jgi:Zn-finger nucleic acid-binding protein